MFPAFLHRLQEIFTANADADQAEPMKRYMKDHFPFLGIKTPERNALFKKLIKEMGLPDLENTREIVRACWELPEREFQYAAMTLLEKHKKKLVLGDVTLLEDIITTKSWWDTVDLLASHPVGELFLHYPDLVKPYTDKWLDSNHMWLQRTAILFQLRYKEKTNAELLYSCIRYCSGSKEFFIQKAIGWALREYSKTNPTSVLQFINTHSLAPLSVREGLKVIHKK